MTLYQNNVIIIMGVDDDDIYNNAAWRVINAPPFGLTQMIHLDEL
nr:MAG TPA: hypothetical protein [Caudoviricetes sp.]